ncbi:hypothetical protein E2C01_098247 [Portunus trituberculatus]|uniref:Uncharacterized protein n=1 Tax=Portunus trituberculatus TaxID=210409 RepID=A0A5B7K0R3_PORTR|nr:hypothetical protein [Portunus trituberculatus]
MKFLDVEVGRPHSWVSACLRGEHRMTIYLTRDGCHASAILHKGLPTLWQPSVTPIWVHRRRKVEGHGGTGSMGVIKGRLKWAGTSQGISNEGKRLESVWSIGGN